MRKLVLALVLVLAISSLAFAAHVDQQLNAMMKDAKGLIPVIVEMNPGAKHLDVASLGGKKGYSWEVINGFSAELPAAAIQALAKNPNVYAISYDQEVTIDLTTAIPTVNSDDLWAMGYTGQGVTIAIVDTGIYPHQDFQNRIIGFKDYINGRTSAYDDNGHGTHCAGIAAGKGTTYKGAAYDAYLVGVKVLNSAGSGSFSTIINGINWCVSNKNTYGIKVLSMSLGGTATQSSTTDPVCAAVRNAWNSGIVVCVAAGNAGPYSGSISTPGIEPVVITVGASDDKGTTYISDDTVASFSSRGPTYPDGWNKPELLAPGVNITACDNAYTGYVTMSGTSMATPLVAGICAQLLELYPSWTPNQIKSYLMSRCRSIPGGCLVSAI